MAKMRLSRKQSKELAESKIVDDQWNRYVRARDNGHTDYLKIADKCNNFYIGDQWDADVLAKLDAQGRPALTINMILSTVNTVLGEQAARRVEFKYKPRNGGREDTASVLTKLSSAVKDANKYDWVESQIFSDAIIQHGRGFFDLRMKFNENMMGDIQITADDPRNVILDPDAKEYDPSTWREVFDTRWVSLDDIEQMYGEAKADELRTQGLNQMRYDPDSLQWEDEAFGTARESDIMNAGNETVSDTEERSIRAIRILERQHVRIVPCLKFVDLESGDMKPVPGSWSEKKTQDFAKRMNMGIIRDLDKKIRWTTSADKVLLHDDWSPYATFTKIPYFAYFRRGKPFGLVTNLLSPQEQLNKLSSQELHILNTTANSGYIVERGSLANMTPDELRNQGAETGVVIETNPGRKDGIEKIKPNQVPTGIERAAMSSAQFIKEISGVNDALLGFDSPELSGVALDQKSNRGQVQLQVPFDNLQKSRFMVANKLVELFQQFYTEERVFNITTEGNTIQTANDPEEFVINQQVAAGEIVNDISVGKYDVVLSTMPARDSFNDAQFAEAVSLRQIGIAIPDDRIVEYSHLDKKFELADEIRDITGRGELTEEQQKQMEFEQNLRNQMAMVEFERAQAEVTKLEAEAMLAAANASQTEGGMDSPAIRIQLEEIESKLMIARENLRLRQGLAMVSAQNLIDKQALSGRAQILNTTVSEREKRRTALLSGAQKGVVDIAKERAKPNPQKATAS